MNSGFEFVLAGVPVKVMWWFFIFVGMIGLISYSDLTYVAIFIGVAFVSILLHEMGHALAYRMFGVQPSIVLQGMGGLTYGRSLPPGKDLLVTIAGPGTGLVIGLATAMIDARLQYSSVMTARVVDMVIFINIAWSIFNLLPMLPLDGGNALNSLLSLILRRDMTQLVRGISIATGAALIAYVLSAYGQGALYMVLLIGFFVYQNVQAFQSRSQAGGGFAPKVSKPPKTSRSRRRPSGPPPTPPFPPTSEGAWRAPTTDDTPPPSKIDTTGWVMPGNKRSFADEINSATQALSRDEPELASIAVDRARRMARTTKEIAVVDQVHAEVLRRISGI